MIVRRNTSKDGFINRLEAWALTHFGPIWRLLQRVGPVERLVNRLLINSAVNKAQARPYRLSTMAPYTSWASLTDKTFNARQLPPAAGGVRTDPPPEHVAALFTRGEQMIECPKSTVLFAYVAQWFTDGFLRSRRPPLPGQPRDITRSESNHEVDLTQLYGLTPQVTDKLRAKRGGLLKSIDIGGEEFPPRLYGTDGARKAEFEGLTVIGIEKLSAEGKGQLFAMGSDVANSQIGYAMLNVLFLREHNRIARELAREHEWDDDRLFSTARNILTVLLIKLVIEEYINHIAPYHFKFKFDPTSFYDARWYRPNWTAVEFNLLYRWHSLVPSSLRVHGAHVPLEGTVFNSELLTRHGLGRVFQDASTQRAGKVCLFNTADWLAQRTGLRSVVQSREVGLASYNDYRADCKFPRVTDFDQISSDTNVREALRAAYGSVEEIEFYVGLFAEDSRPNSVLPSLMGRMVGLHAFSQLMTNPLLAPAVYNEETFSALGMRTIGSTSSFEQLLQRNLPEDSPRYVARLTWEGWQRA